MPPALSPSSPWLILNQQSAGAQAFADIFIDRMRLLIAARFGFVSRGHKNRSQQFLTLQSQIACHAYENAADGGASDGVAEMTCWICGAPADSREHKIKKSDLKSMVGAKLTQADPIYLHTALRKNRRIGSLNANALKYAPSLCQYCNNTRTQRHDYAWACLSEALRSRQPPMTAGQFIRANSIFPYDTRRAMRDVHLYIVKLFGCMITEGGVKEIDIGTFANAILNDRIHRDVYAAFGPAPRGEVEDKVVASGSDLEMDVRQDGRCAYAVWIHHVGSLWVRVMYALDDGGRQGLGGAWNPRFGSKRLLMAEMQAVSAKGTDLKDRESDHGSADAPPLGFSPNSGAA